MRHLYCLFAVLLLLLASGACARKKGGVNVGPLQTQFQKAEAPIKADIDSAIKALEAGRHSEALAYLNKVALKAKLTADQQQAVKTTIDQITALLKEKTQAAVDQASKSLPKK